MFVQVEAKCSYSSNNVSMSGLVEASVAQAIAGIYNGSGDIYVHCKSGQIHSSSAALPFCMCCAMTTVQTWRDGL